MWPKSRLILWVITVFALIFWFNSKVFADNGETYFVITAYYSPLPWQLKYTTWSYSGDVRLNGEWHTTASWEWVFPGLLAGPSNYPFGTKIYFEWYGVGVIEDRGWAIVKAWERGHSYDRIDIWMWYWDEGLTRALNWWTRTIKWKIVVPSSEVSIDFWESQIWTLTKLSVNPENTSVEDVKEVQIVFTKANLYSWEIDGKYESIKNEIIDFQISAWIISSSSDDAAWWYGPKTIAALRSKYGNSNENLVKEPIENFYNTSNPIASEYYKIILDYWNLTVWPDSDSEDILDLQNLLTQLWEYSGSKDGKYSSVENALLELQMKIGLIKDKDDWWAGYFGNKTKSALWIYYEDVGNKKIVSSTIWEYKLSADEKFKISSAFSRLTENKSSSYTSLLLDQIDRILPKYQDNPIVKAKILYIQEIAQ